MDFQISGQTFLVLGATSGFGKSTVLALLAEGATVLGVARKKEALYEIEKENKGKFIPIVGDITLSETIDKVADFCTHKNISGVLVNAGGPPAMSFEETTLENWDNAYRIILRWKVELTQKLLPLFKSKQYGRLVYIESSSVKQPYDNLILSTSLRLAVAGMVKTVSQELSGNGITFNIIAPGSHDTPALNRLIQKKSEDMGISLEEVKRQFVENTPAKILGNPEGVGSLAAWLLSPLAEFVTGQVYAIEGGAVKSTL